MYLADPLQEFENRRHQPVRLNFQSGKAPICPIRIESEMPAKNPVRIGRDRKLARTPSEMPEREAQGRHPAPAPRQGPGGPPRRQRYARDNGDQNRRQYRHRRGVRPNDQLPRRTEQSIGDQRRDAGVNAGLGRQPRDCRIGDGARKTDRRNGKPRRKVVSQPAGPVSGEARQERDPKRPAAGTVGLRRNRFEHSSASQIRFSPCGLPRWRPPAQRNVQCAPLASVVRHLPIVARIEAVNVGDDVVGRRPKVGLVDDAVMADDKGGDAGLFILTGQASRAKPAIMLPLIT